MKYQLPSPCISFGHGGIMKERKRHFSTKEEEDKLYEKKKTFRDFLP